MDDDPSHMKDGFKRIAERALQAEMLQHLGDDKHAAVGKNTSNSRNGISPRPSLPMMVMVKLTHRVIETAVLSRHSWVNIRVKSTVLAMK